MTHADFPFHPFRSYPGSLPKVKTLSLSLYERTSYHESTLGQTLAALQKCPAVEEVSLRLLMLPVKFPHTRFLRKLDLLRCVIDSPLFGTTLSDMKNLTDLKFSFCRGALLSEEIVSALRSTSLERLLIFPQLASCKKMLDKKHVEHLLEHVTLDYLCIDVDDLETWVKAFPVRMANPQQFALTNVSRVSFGVVFCEESVYVNGVRAAHPCQFKYR